MGTACALHVQEHHTKDRVMGQLEAYYQDLLKERA